MRRPAGGVVDVWLGRARAGFAEQVLSRYLGRAPVLERGERGKPQLSTGELQFNLSHSGALAAVAVSAEHPVGVDIERLRPLEPIALARRFLAPEEADSLVAVPKAQQGAAFLRLWTAKEAYVKALGTGIGATPPGTFVIDGMSVVRTHDGAPGTTWSLSALPLADGYCGTLAVRGPLTRVRIRGAGLTRR